MNMLLTYTFYLVGTEWCAQLYEVCRDKAKGGGG